MRARPAAYCVPGRPAAIVLTSAALAVLDPGQLTAVLAHERAHLAGRHHLLIALTRGLAAAFPGVPLFTRAPAEVARLAEMCADDAAARRSSRPALVTALLAMGTGTAVPAAALAATTCAVSARVQRLLEPAPRARHARNRLALGHRDTAAGPGIRAGHPLRRRTGRRTPCGWADRSGTDPGRGYRPAPGSLGSPPRR